MRRPHPSWLLPLVLPAYWRITAGPGAVGRRTTDLVSHVWAIWNGAHGDPTRTTLLSWPDGLDLLPIYGGWLHTFVGTALVHLGDAPTAAYSTVVCTWLAVAGLAGIALARTLGARPWAAAVGGMLLQLDGFVLYNATDGRPEHAGLGFTTLALAAALHLWHRGGRPHVIRTALAGALVFLVSWEHALWLALALAWLLPWLHTTPTNGRRRWLQAAGLAAAIATPWLVLFLSRALAARTTGEGHSTLLMAVDQSTGLLSWFLSAGRHPARGLFLLAVGLPWLVPRTHRRLAVGVLLGLFFSLLLALGPSPGLWEGGDLWRSASDKPMLFGPFAVMQQLPVLGWFHSPARLAMGVSIAIAGAGALLVDRLSTRSRPLAIVVGLALPTYAAVDAQLAGNWPTPGFAIPAHPATELAQHTVDGAVLALPPTAEPWQHEQRAVLQMLHHRPITGHLFLDHLATDHTADLVYRVPLLAWVSEGAPRARAPTLSPSDRAFLVDQGVAIVTVHHKQLETRRSADISQALRTAFGAPMAEQAGRWSAYAVRSEPGRP